MHGSHDHGHDHSHGHGHNHDIRGAGAADLIRRLRPAFVLTFGFMIAEAVGGYLSGSLALLADAGHMLTDAGALALALAGVRLAARPSDNRRSYGYGRAQVLAAFVNAITLLGVTVWIVFEAFRRFQQPHEVLAKPMLVVAVLGLLVNILVFAILHRGDRNNLNLRGAWLHVIGDMLGSVGAIIAAIVIMLTGWTPIDPILSVFMALLICGGAINLLRRSGHILLEGAPPVADEATLSAHLLESVPGVEDIHHVHLWMLTENEPLVTLHARITAEANADETLQAIKTALTTAFGLTHVTVQIERGEVCPDGEQHQA
ncbi:cation diffusion facilitator family transporter [Govanella unica]|nr:cation diffusion facilitator family transporter [Govania unica]